MKNPNLSTLYCAMSLLALLSSRALSAQVVETPQAFDSNGKVYSLTPSAAARIGLGPPEWPVFGDYVEARLYQTSAGANVIIVTRRDQSLERYQISLADINAIRTKVNALPPQFAFRSQGRASSAFVRNQTLMGLGVYGPALSLAVANEGTGRASTYLVAAGLTFFAASQLARQIQITPEMNSLSTHMGLRGALVGLGVTLGLKTSDDAVAAGALIGALGGTATGLAVGSNWDPQEVVASEIGSNVVALTTLGVINIGEADGDVSESTARSEILLLSGATIAGYVLGRSYGNSVSHNITQGDGATLWVTGALGVAAASITYAGRAVSYRSQALAVTAGYVGGVVAGELLLSRRFDLALSDATLLGLGSGAGGLIGLGIAELTDSSGETNARTMTFAGTRQCRRSVFDALPAGSTTRRRTRRRNRWRAIVAAVQPGRSRYDGDEGSW